MGHKNLEIRTIRNVLNAVRDFEMIQDWDTILLWVSWGKDSMLLGYIMKQIQARMKNKFKIRWVYIFKEFLINCDIMFEEKRKYFEDVLWIPLEKVNIELPKDSKLNNWIWVNCQWCAYARRIAMMKLCEKRWATKICYGHHLDDIVVTMFMNMIQWRKLKIMPPVNKMRQWDITFIRPLAYVREKDILRLVQELEIPYSPCLCPVWEDSKRKEIKELIRNNEKIMPEYTDNIFAAAIKDFKQKLDLWIAYD